MTTDKRGLTSDLLRISAMLFVVLLHGRTFLPQADALPSVLNWLSFLPAWAGVWIFLILSGYGIGVGYFTKKIRFTDETGKLRARLFFRFYFSRFIKLAPLYYLYCVLFELLSGRQFFWSSPKMLLKMAFFLFNGEGGISGIGHLWYVSMAMQLYLLMPFLLLLVDRLSRNKACILIAYIAIVSLGLILRCRCEKLHVDWYRVVYTNSLMNLDLVLGGMIIAAIRYGNEIRMKKTAAMKIISALVFVLLVLYNCRVYLLGGYLVYRYILPSVYLLSCGFLLFYSNEASGKPLSQFRRFVHWLAGQTYSMYVFHIAVFEYLKLTVFNTPLFSSLSPTGQYVFFFILALPLTLLVSVPMTLFVQAIAARFRTRGKKSLPAGNDPGRQGTGSNC